MNIITVAEKASTALTAAGKLPALQAELSASVGAVQAWSMTKLDSALGYLSLNTTELKAFKNVLNTGNDTLIAAALVQAILAKEKAQEDFAASETATFRASVHAALKASVEGHTELGKMVYEGERKTYADGLMSNAELGQTELIIDKLPPQPGNTPDQNTVFNTNRASQIVEANKARNVSYLTELLDSAIAIKYPFKTVAAGNGITETITLKQRVGDVGPGTKVFFWMEDLMNNTTYGWQIDGANVDGVTFGNVHDAWVSAAKATDTGLEAGGQGLTNAGEDVVTGAGAIVDAAAGALAGAAAALNPMQGMMDMLNGVVALAVTMGVLAVVCIGLGVIAYILYKKFKKSNPALLADAQAQLGGVGEKLKYASGYATDYYTIQTAILKDTCEKNPDAIAIALQAEGVPMAATKAAIGALKMLPPQSYTPRTDEGKKVVEEAKKQIPDTNAAAQQLMGMMGGMGGMGGGMPGMGAPPPAAPPAAAPVAGAPPAAAPAQQQVDPQQAMALAKLASSMA